MESTRASSSNRRIVALFFAAALAAAISVGCKATEEASGTATKETAEGEGEEKEELSEGEYQYVSAADTLKASDVHILDVREWEKYAAGRVLYPQCTRVPPTGHNNSVQYPLRTLRLNTLPASCMWTY